MMAGGAHTWDVMILNFDGHAPLPVASFRPGHGPRPMGSAARVREAIDSALVGVDWSDPKLGVLDDAGAPRLEIDLGGGADALTGFVVHVKGRRGAAELIAHLCLVNGWAALDCGRGTFLDLYEPAEWPVTTAPSGQA
jgi:hypothetical protein